MTRVSLCARPPGPCLGASGLGGKEATAPLPDCLPGQDMVSCATSESSTLGETLPSLRLSFPSYKMGMGDTLANVISEIFLEMECHGSKRLRTLFHSRVLLLCDVQALETFASDLEQVT